MNASAPRSSAVSEAKPPAEAARERLTGELRTAMKARDPITVATVRGLLSALDNTSAIPLAPRHRIVSFRSSAEAPRHDATWPEIEAVFAAELDERKTAAADYDRRGLSDDAARLRVEMAIIARLWPEPASRGD